MGNLLAPYLGNFAYFFVPFADFSKNWMDPLIIIAAVIWSIVVEVVQFDIPWNIDEIVLIVNILSGTMGFLLSLNLTKYMSRNKDGIALFETYVGTVESTAWFLSTMDIESKLRNELYTVLKILPTSLKHVFRKDFSYDEMIKDEKDQGIIQFVSELRVLDPEAKEPMDSILFLFMIKIRKLKKDKFILHGKWESLFNPYETISSIVAYDVPDLFEYILGSALVIYTLFLPMSYSERNQWNIAITFFVMYFFVGLNAAGLMLQNPFVGLPKGVTVFPTATAASKISRKNIQKILNYCNNEICVTKYAKKKLKI